MKNVYFLALRLLQEVGRDWDELRQEADILAG